jgi:hypothetical protein
MKYRSKHSIIAAIIAAVALTVIIVFFNSDSSSNEGSRIITDKITWYMPDTATTSISRIGYNSLYTAAQSQYNASIHYLPWTPDNSPEMNHSTAEFYFLIINAPERKWNKLESENLVRFVQAGGEILIVTPAPSHYNNIKEFFKTLSLNFKNQRDKPLFESFALYPVKAAATPAFYNYFEDSDEAFFHIRPSSLKIQLPYGFLPLITQNKNVLLSVKTINSVKKGRIFWLNGVLPGFNGEKGDLKYTDSPLKQILKEKKIDDSLREHIKKKYGRDIDFDNYFGEKYVFPKISDAALSSSLRLIDSFFVRAVENERSIVFFDYLREPTTVTDSLALYSSGAFYALILIAILLFSAIIFYARAKIPFSDLREIRFRTNELYPASQIDPAITRQTRSRFYAQYIHISKMLKKTRG